jgi:hypothetical protein
MAVHAGRWSEKMGLSKRKSNATKDNQNSEHPPSPCGPAAKKREDGQTQYHKKTPPRAAGVLSRSPTLDVSRMLGLDGVDLHAPVATPVLSSISQIMSPSPPTPTGGPALALSTSTRGSIGTSRVFWISAHLAKVPLALISASHRCP